MADRFHKMGDAIRQDSNGGHWFTCEAPVGNSVPSNFAPLELVPFNEACKPFLKDAWLVEDVLPGQGLAVMFGAPSSGKTFTAIDLACHVASGLGDWRGNHVEHRAVLYLSLEGGKPFRNRLHAWCKHYEMNSACFCLCSEKLDLRAPDTDCNRVIAAGRRIADESGRPVGLVVVDTLNRAMPGGNENAVEDMGAFVAHCDAIARALTCLVLIIHHSGKDAAKGSRGHSSLLGAIDCELSVADSAITVTKQRDGEAGAFYGFNLAPVEIGASEKRGKLVFSCVAEPAEAPKKRPILGPRDKRVLGAVREYLADYGKPSPGGTGWPERGAILCAPQDAFLDFAKEREPGGSARDKRKNARRGLMTLVKKGLVGTNGSHVWETPRRGAKGANGGKSPFAPKANSGSEMGAKGARPFRGAPTVPTPPKPNSEAIEREGWQ